MTEQAKAFAATVREVQAKRITVDEGRQRNAALRSSIGDSAYDAAKREAMVAIARNRA